MLLSSEDDQGLSRKRVRKGTKSCWECKRRKVKCMPTADPSICVGCRDRRTRCQKQKYVDDAPSHKAEDSGLVCRMARMESMLEALMERMSGPTSSTISPLDDGSVSGAPADIDSLDGKLERLRRELKDKLPCQADLDALFASSYGWWLIQQHMMPNTNLTEDDESLSIELVLKGHPMQIARLLLCTTIAIQQLPQGVSALNIPPGERLQEKRNSLFAFIIQNVLSDDEMIGNIEGVECLALQGLYEVNAGNLRRALLAFRKAITMAQLLGLHRGAYQSSPVYSGKGKHHHLWYQISRGERYLSTILGVPSSTDSVALSSFRNDASWLSPEDRYHRQLYYISGLILARNQGDATHSFSTTQRIGEEFVSLALQMPPGWWDIPAEFLNTRTKDASAQFERVMCQVWHFELVTLLHLPFMLHAATDRRYEHSQISCLDASRSLIQRWIAIRGSRTSLLLSKLLDFQAFTAATTLLLGLLGMSNNRDSVKNRDSELIDMVIQNFERFECDDGGKSVNAQSISVLRTLQRSLSNREEDQCNLHIEIPFFGVIQLSNGAVQPVEGERLLGANSLRSSTSRFDTERGTLIPHSTLQERQRASGIDGDENRYTDSNASNTVLHFVDEHFQLPQAIDTHAEWPLEAFDTVFFDSLINTDLVGNWTI